MRYHHDTVIFYRIDRNGQIWYFDMVLMWSAFFRCWLYSHSWVEMSMYVTCNTNPVSVGLYLSNKQILGGPCYVDIRIDCLTYFIHLFKLYWTYNIEEVQWTDCPSTLGSSRDFSNFFPCYSQTSLSLWSLPDSLSFLCGFVRIYCLCWSKPQRRTATSQWARSAPPSSIWAPCLAPSRRTSKADSIPTGALR